MCIRNSDLYCLIFCYVERNKMQKIERLIDCISTGVGSVEEYTHTLTLLHSPPQQLPLLCVPHSHQLPLVLCLSCSVQTLCLISASLVC